MLVMPMCPTDGAQLEAAVASSKSLVMKNVGEVLTAVIEEIMELEGEVAKAKDKCDGDLWSVVHQSFDTAYQLTHVLNLHRVMVEDSEDESILCACRALIDSGRKAARTVRTAIRLVK